VEAKISKWVAYSQHLGGVMQYRAGRIIDTSQPLHGGNVEYFGDYSPDKEAVLKICAALERGEWCGTCGNPDLQPSGTCKICPVCGTSTGCS